jgi:hypothetical protein
VELMRRPRLAREWYSVVFILVGGLVLIAAVGYLYFDQRRFSQCEARYDTALQQRSQSLQRIAAEDRQVSKDAEGNVTRLITDAVKAQGDRAKGQAAVDRFFKTSRRISAKRAELDAQRAAQPFPQTPEKACT